MVGVLGNRHGVLAGSTYPGLLTAVQITRNNERVNVRTVHLTFLTLIAI